MTKGEVVEVGIGQDGDSKTTCVIVFVENGAVDNAAKIKAKSKKLAPQAVTALPENSRARFRSGGWRAGSMLMQFMRAGRSTAGSDST
jgi:hypothetical protein